MAGPYLNSDQFDARGTLGEQPFSWCVETIEAGVAITVGQVVAPDETDDDGKEGEVAVVATGPNMIGVYTGVGGTGAATTVSGLTGNDAAIGDRIQVKWKGAVMALTDGGTTDILTGDMLSVSAAGKFVKQATQPTNGEGNAGIARAITGDTTDGASLVWLK